MGRAEGLNGTIIKSNQKSGDFSLSALVSFGAKMAADKFR
jgi:hypothetical protein